MNIKKKFHSVFVPNVKIKAVFIEPEGSISRNSVVCFTVYEGSFVDKKGGDWIDYEGNILLEDGMLSVEDVDNFLGYEEESDMTDLYWKEKAKKLKLWEDKNG